MHVLNESRQGRKLLKYVNKMLYVIHEQGCLWAILFNTSDVEKKT